MSSNKLCVSKLKNHGWFAGALNMLLTSNFMANRGQWSKVRSKENHLGNIRKIGANKFNKTMRNVLGSRRTVKSASSDPALKKLAMLLDPATNVCPVVNEEMLVDEINTIIYNSESPLVSGYNDFTNNTRSENASKYSDITQWLSPDTTINPKFAEIRSLMPYMRVILLNALCQVLTVEEREAIVESSTIPDDLIAKLGARLKLFETQLATEETVDGIPAVNYVKEAINFVKTRQNVDNTDYIVSLCNFHKNIEPGIHIAYQFGGGYMHHAVHIGDSLVIEVLNVDVPGANKRVQAFITMNHLDHFINRVMTNASDFLVHTYDTHYPLNVIKARAGWALGRFPNYHIVKESCENFVAWVMSNKYEASMCMLPKGLKLSDYEREMDELTISINSPAYGAISNSNIESVSGGKRVTKNNARSKITRKIKK